MKYFLCLITILFLSCNQDFLDFENNIEEQPQALALSQEDPTYFDWNTFRDISLYGYRTVLLPWIPEGSELPEFVINNYKTEDGWELVYNRCYSPQARYYLMFYNIFTGIFRVYYYNTESVTNADATFWQFHLSNSTSLLNSIGHFSYPMNFNAANDAFILNITGNQVKAIRKGWNCFDIEMCYDNDAAVNTLRFTISSYDQKTENIQLSGGIDLKSTGTIVATTTTNPIVDNTNSAIKKLGSSVGDSIASGLGKKILPGILQSAVSSIISGGTTEIVKAGINLVFGSFLGRLGEPTNSTQSLNVTTNGTLNLTGSINGNSSSNIYGIGNLLFPSSTPTSVDNFFPIYNNLLGVWNITSTPVVKMQKDVMGIRLNPGVEPGTYECHQKVNLDESTVNILINPVVLSLVSKYETKSELVYYHMFNKKTDWGNDVSNIYHYFDGNIIFSDSTNVFYKGVSTLNYTITDPKLKYTSDSGVKNVILDQGLSNTNFVVKVTVTLYPKSPYNTTPIVMTRTYRPRYVLY